MSALSYLTMNFHQYLIDNGNAIQTYFFFNFDFKTQSGKSRRLPMPFVFGKSAQNEWKIKTSQLMVISIFKFLAAS